MSTVVLIALFLVGWPRLENTSIHYDLIQLRAEVAELTRQERALSLELEVVRNPARLVDDARSVGLVPPTAHDVAGVGPGEPR
jgi:hypothetical protein